MHYGIITLATNLLILSLTMANIQASEFTVGQKVIAIRDSDVQMTAKDLQAVTRRISTGNVFLIEKIHHNNLLMRDQAWTGWINVADVANLDRGFTVMSNLINSGRGSHRIFDGRGRIFMQRGEFAEAQADLTNAIKLAPDEPDHLINRGICYLYSNNFKEARADLERCIDLLHGTSDATSKASAHYHCGLTHYAENNYRKAITEFDAAIAHDPNYVFAINRRGMAWRQLKQLNNALNDFDRAIKLSPNFVAPHNYRGLVLWELGRYHDAIAAFETAIAFSPHSIFALGTISHDLFHRISQLPNPPLSEYWQLDPEMSACNNLARLLITCPDDFKNIKRASELVDKIKSQDHGRYYVFLITEAMLLEAQGHQAASLQLRKRAASHAPADKPDALSDSVLATGAR
jgi:tetratricopeptide (TPR) repeat protein